MPKKQTNDKELSLAELGAIANAVGMEITSKYGIMEAEILLYIAHDTVRLNRQHLMMSQQAPRSSKPN